MTVGTVTASAGSIQLAATAGAIVDGNAAMTNLAAAANSTLTAGMTIGTSSDPLDVNVTETLSVSAGGSSGGVSIAIDGRATLNVMNMPPGQVLLNGQAVSSTTSTRTLSGTATAEILRTIPDLLALGAVILPDQPLGPSAVRWSAGAGTEPGSRACTGEAECPAPEGEP
jgi:hypothetical protein